MADVVAHPRVLRHATAKLKRRRDDLWIALSALTAAMLALPFAHNSWNGPEVAAVLAVSATAMLAGQRWAIALVVIAELMLVPTIVPRAFSGGPVWIGAVNLASLAMLVPGLLATRRAAAALVLLTGWRRTQRTCRRFHLALMFALTLVGLLPIL
ncbi:MAG: hypothetical protein H0T46_35380 [Deltaproteobacteria bacterium]|nr:hypothetical protein [Deltaproteobacteria bacterium]